MVSWIGDGGLSCYYPPVNRPPDIANNEIAYLLATNAMVNVEAPTRLQYTLNNSLILYGLEVLFDADDRINARANFSFTEGDASADPSRKLTASMFVSPASDFAVGVTPTQQQVIDAANVQVFRATVGGPNSDYDGYSSAGDYAFGIYGPRASALTRNRKYWVLVVATTVPNLVSSPTVGRDIPINAVNGRGLSVWTNRPAAAPVITSPLDGATAPAGSILDLTFVTRDPDRATGKNNPNYWDLAGAQAQIAPQPTVENPTPTWVDIPVLAADGISILPMWALVGTSLQGGGVDLVKNKTMPLACATVPPTPLVGQLASGAWQLRIRTFDFGHPFPGFMAAFAAPHPPGELAAITPADAPASNTSPWSEPVNLTISEQVPAPIPMSPINSVAVAEGAAVTLSWLYRNTYVPPFAQMSRTVQIRQVGEVAWTTLVSGNSASPAYLISGYALDATHGYEWRVQVTDTSGGVSPYSAVGTFWVVPAPVSGSVRPVPSETVEGATLGVGTYRVFVYRRGGSERVGELSNLSHVDWNRVRDDLSDAKVVVSFWGVDSGDLLRKLQCWAYELVLFRDNGFSVDRVWEGPITLLTYERDSVTIHAKDVMAYAYRRIVKQAMNDNGNSPTAGDSVVSRATKILQNVMAPDDPNVLAYLTPLIREDDARQYRSLPPYSRTAFEEVDDMAANAGLDYTCSGRSILLWGTKHRIGTLPEFRDADLGAPPIVSEYGMSMANRYVVSDGNGIWGEATRGLDPVSGNDETYGLVEMLSSTWANETEEEVGTYTEAGIETLRESFREYAERSIADRYPPPVVVRVPDNTTLNPDAVLSIQQLVPGVVIPLRSTGTLRSVVASQKLDKVQVTETSGSEVISITLSPFSRDDIEAVDGGE